MKLRLDQLDDLPSAIAAGDYILVRRGGRDYKADDSLLPPDARGQLRADLANSAMGALLVAAMPLGAGAVARLLSDKAHEFVSEADYGAVGDGLTNDGTALVNAANAAVNAGRTLSLNGSKTYAVSGITLPAGLRMVTNGATFVDAVGTTSNTPLVNISSGSVIDEIKAHIPTGLRRDRGVVISGADPCFIGRVRVTSVDQQANTGDNQDAAVRINTSARPEIGTIEVENFDRAVLGESTAEIRIGHASITSYCTGLWVSNCPRLVVGGASITEASPNAFYTPGHVGVLLSCDVIGASRNVVLSNFVIEDSGEHGIRVGGPLQQENISFINPRIKNVGGSGIKVLGTDAGAPTDQNKRIVIDNPIIEDCGSGGLTSNMCGITLMYCAEVQVNNPIIRKQDKLQSGYAGIRVVASSDVHITEPEVEDATFDGIWLDGSLGDLTRITVTGGMSRNNGRDGYRAAAGANTMRRLKVDGLSCDSNGGLGLTIAVGGGTLVDSYFRAKLYGNANGSVACDSVNANLDITGLVGATPLSGITAANGSVFRDTIIYHRMADKWLGRGRVALAANVVNNNAVANTMQDVTGLALAVKAGVTYDFRFVIPYIAAATTTGSRWSINGPVATFLRYRSEYTLGLTSRTVNEGLGGAYDAPAAANTDSAVTSGRNLAIVEGRLTPNVDGTLQARFASEVAGSAITATAHAYLEWEELHG